MQRNPTAGVTMIEMLVAVAIFAVIGAAGFSVLDTVARTDRQLDGRLARLTQSDLAMRLFATDMTRATGYRFLPDNDALALNVAGGVVTYQSTETGVQRVVTLAGQPPLAQLLLPPQKLRWEIGDADGVWRLAEADAQGRAVALVLGRDKKVRILARLPQMPAGRK